MRQTENSGAARGIRRVMSFLGNPAVIAFVYVAALYLLAWRLYGIRFETNDDVGYMYAASGFTTGTPSPPATHMNILYARLLAFLYTVTRAVPWYPLVFMGLIFCSCWCILTFFLKMFRDKGRPLYFPLIIYTAFHITAVWRYSVVLQFTYVPAICGAAACVIYYYIQQNPLKRTPPPLLGLFAFFLFFAFTIRKDGYICAAPFVLLLFMFGLAKVIKREVSPKKAVVAPLVIVLIFAATQIADYAYRAGTDWEAFGEYNTARSGYMDYKSPTYEEAPELYESVGWPEELKNMVGAWFLMDERVTTEAFETLNAGKGAYMEARPGVAGALTRTFENLRWMVPDTLYVWPFVACAVLAAAAGILNTQKGRRWQALCAVAVCAANFGCVTLLAYIGRSPVRVLFAFLVCAAALIAYMLLESCCAGGEKRERIKIKGTGISLASAMVSALSYAAVCLLVLHIGDVNIDTRNYYSQYNPNAETIKNHYVIEHPQEIYIYDISLAGCHVNPAEVYAGTDVRNMFFHGGGIGGGMIDSPFYAEQLAANGLDALYSDRFFAPNVRYMTRLDNFDDKAIMKYMRATYGNVRAELMDTIPVDGDIDGWDILVYRFIRE